MTTQKPLSPAETQQLLSTLGHTPVKKLGQNFLIDGNIVHKSIELAKVTAEDTVIEIGPGLGTLTRTLLNQGATVYAIEYDKRLHAYLSKNIQNGKKNVFNLTLGDAVKNPLASYTKDNPFKIVANLPYAISTPWLDKVLEATNLPTSLTLMLQKEAADRFQADAEGNNLGAISIFLNGAYSVEAYHKVARQCFYPIPKVDSGLLYLERKAEPIIFPNANKQIIRDLFTQRRKQIGSIVRKHPQAAALEPWLVYLEENGIERNTRPGAIPIQYWNYIATIV